jgi:hypothetical protein
VKFGVNPGTPANGSLMERVPTCVTMAMDGRAAAIGYARTRRAASCRRLAASPSRDANRARQGVHGTPGAGIEGEGRAHPLPDDATGARRPEPR